MTSETSSSIRFTLLDHRGSNYPTWQTTAKFDLMSQKVWKYFDPLNAASSPPEKYSAEDQSKIDKGTESAANLQLTKTYTDWQENCEVAIARLARLVDPVVANLIDPSASPKACWDALAVRFAGRSAQGVVLLQTRLAAMRFLDDDSNSLPEFLAAFDGLVLDLQRAGHAYSEAEVCSKIALAMPMSLQSTVSSLQEGNNSTNPGHWFSALSTSWERLKAVRAAETTYSANRAVTSGSSNARDDSCRVCRKMGHYARDCPTLTPEERAQRQERWRNRARGRRAGNATTPAQPDYATQIAQLSAKLAALEATSKGSDTGSSGYDAHAKVSILCASMSSLHDVARVGCIKQDNVGDTVLRAGGGKIPANYAAIDSGASRHCASERSFFINYRVLEDPRKVFLGDDRFILAVGEGDFRVWVNGPSGERECIVFSRTLHVPDLACTLISIRQLTRDVRPTVHAVFLDNTCEIRAGDRLIFRAVADDSASGLYVLHMLSAPRPTLRTPVLALAAFTASKAATSLDPHIAHARFGHLNTNDLLALVRKQLQR